VVDDAGLIVKEHSLENLLEAYTDFANEKTQLEYVCGCLGVKVVITTKYHAELFLQAAHTAVNDAGIHRLLDISSCCALSTNRGVCR
jgi:hypothetical protein